MVHMLRREVGDKSFVIHTMKRFEKDSDTDWSNDGFDVYYKDNKVNFLAYPTDDELLCFAEIIDK